MECVEMLDLVEAIAAGDSEPAEAARGHFETCPRCAAALASARRIETALAVRPAPPAPPRFTSGVFARIRRERWRAEQQVDRLFNLAMAVAVLLMLGGILALANIGAVLSAAGRGWELLVTMSGATTDHAASAVRAYVAAAGLFASAVAMWWWAERRLPF